MRRETGRVPACTSIRERNGNGNGNGREHGSAWLKIGERTGTEREREPGSGTVPERIREPGTLSFSAAEIGNRKSEIGNRRSRSIDRDSPSARHEPLPERGGKAFQRVSVPSHAACRGRDEATEPEVIFRRTGTTYTVMSSSYP